MTGDPRELAPCKLWLEMGAALARGVKRTVVPELAETPIAVTAKHPLERVTQRLLGLQGQLRYELAVQMKKPGKIEARWDEQAWPGARVETSGKTLRFAQWIDGRDAAVQRMLVESQFMAHAHPFATESKLDWMEYGYVDGAGMTSHIEGEWKGSDEDEQERWARFGFVPFDDRKGLALVGDEIEMLFDPTKSLPSGIVLRDPDGDAVMALRGAVTLEVRWGAAARPRTRAARG